MGTRIWLSPVTGLPTTYVEHSVLMTCQPGDPVPPDSLRTAMNIVLFDHGYDAFVDNLKVFYEPLHTNVQGHLWIAEESPIGAFIALAILILCASVVGTVWILSSSVQTIIEHFWPKAKFYQTDALGNQIVVGSLAEYISCQRTAHPNEYVCGYCGQVFPTIEERDAHEAVCPWKEGVPGQPPEWFGVAIIGLGSAVVLGGIWLVGQVVGRKEPIIITR